MSRETLCCVFQVLSFGMDPLFWICQKAKIWSPYMVEPVLKLFRTIESMKEKKRRERIQKGSTTQGKIRKEEL